MNGTAARVTRIAPPITKAREGRRQKTLIASLEPASITHTSRPMVAVNPITVPRSIPAAFA